MEEWTKAIAVLPPEVVRILERVPLAVKERAQEIRFRKNSPLTLSLPEKDHCISSFICTGELLYNTFLHLCEYSVHSHQEELRHGYISAKNGARIGISGRAVLENGRVVSVRDITGVCFRLSRSHPNCAKEIAFTVNKEQLHSLLICGQPASGKTSLLRDLISQLTTGEHPRRLAVVDERGELLLGKDLPCEVLLGYPKAVGIEQALRTLSPEGIVFDELGSEEEVKAVLQCLHGGVAAICTLHADGIESLKRRPAARAALQSGAFRYVALLKGRQRPGEIAGILKAEEIAL